MLIYIALLLVLVLIVIVLVFIISRHTTSNGSSILPEVPAIDLSNEPLTVIMEPFNTVAGKEVSQLSEYCSKWDYKFQTYMYADGTSLVLQDDPGDTKVNMNQSLDFFRHLLRRTEYIAFYGTKNYFTRGAYQWTQISKQVTPISYMSPGDLNDRTIRNILAHGYPHATNNGLILHRSYLDLILYGKPLPFVLPHLMPAVTLVRSEYDAKVSSIPKIIHQTFETALLPPALKSAVDTWINLNPDYEHRYFSDADRRNFIKQHFEPVVLRAYDKLIPGSYRADLWRYCVIYQNGGVYVDIKLGALVPMSQIITNDVDMVLVNDNLDGSMFTSFFAAVPKHPALRRCIDITVQRVMNEEYGPYMVYPTGPLAMGAAMLPMFGFRDHMPNGLHNNLLVYSHYLEDNNIYVKDATGTRLIKFRYITNFTEEDVHNITGRRHYKMDWKEHKAYRK